MIPRICFVIVVVTAVGGSVLQHEKRIRGRADDTMPSFKDIDCKPELSATLCVKVTFKDGTEDVLVLTKSTKFINTGSLKEDNEVEVVAIDNNDGTRTYNFNSDKVESCASFLANLESGKVTCLKAVANTDADEDRALSSIRNRAITEANKRGPIINLGKYFDSTGIPIKALITFDTAFYSAFDGKNGKSGDDYMDEVMALAKNAFADKNLKSYLGTKINLIPTKKKHYSSFPNTSKYTAGSILNMVLDSEEIVRLANAGGNYDVFTFVSHPGAAGVAWGGQVCAKGNSNRINYNMAYGEDQCNNYVTADMQPYACTISERIAFTSETIAHELGHVLGMAHDFDQDIYQKYQKYVYRKFGDNGDGRSGSDCRGLMDYIDDGVGWSKCSARDFSRYITNGGTTSPCLSRNGRGSTDENTGVNGNWGSWGSYGSCSVTCGEGSKTKTRQCNNPRPQNGGKDCSGSPSRSRTCNEGSCPKNECKDKSSLCNALSGYSDDYRCKQWYYQNYCAYSCWQC